MVIDVLLAPAFGSRGSTSNLTMGSWIARRRESFSYVLVQHEVGAVMEALGAKPDFRVYRHRTLWSYLDTPEVVRQMMDWLPIYRLRGVTVRVWVVCHKTHWKACRYFLRKRYGILACRVDVDVPYDPKSGQWPTRGPLRAALYKPVAVFRYLRNGDIKLFRRSSTVR